MTSFQILNLACDGTTSANTKSINRTFAASEVFRSNASRLRKFARRLSLGGRNGASSAQSVNRSDGINCMASLSVNAEYLRFAGCPYSIKRAPASPSSVEQHQSV